MLSRVWVDAPRLLASSPTHVQPSSNTTAKHQIIQPKGPFMCYVTLFFWKLDPHPPPRNANNIEHYTFVTFFSRKPDTPATPSALRNSWMAPNTNTPNSNLVSPPSHHNHSVALTSYLFFLVWPPECDNAAEYAALHLDRKTNVAEQAKLQPEKKPVKMAQRWQVGFVWETRT